MNTSSKKVFVGLSGGVDSSVSALLLKKAGYNVTGVFIKVWQPEWITCTWKEDRLDAMRICAALDIPFTTLDLESEYKKEVVDYMISEYSAGRTPNPDVMCNKHVKFGAFYDWAMKNGADYVATGHYAQVKNDELYMGKDSNKDQSYFLWTLTKKQLEYVLFPIGHLEKPEVRKIAEKNNLITATKKDSQGLCFIGKIDMKDFLKEYIKSKKGNILNEKGETIGFHDGAIFYTIGERHGFTVTKKTAHDEPYYVSSKDLADNTITVTRKLKEGGLSNAVTEVRLEQVNWISDIPSLNETYHARARYRQELQECAIRDITDTTAVLAFRNPQSTISGGQSMVIYDGTRCVGGGVIA